MGSGSDRTQAASSLNVKTLPSTGRLTIAEPGAVATAREQRRPADSLGPWSDGRRALGVEVDLLRAVSAVATAPGSVLLTVGARKNTLFKISSKSRGKERANLSPALTAVGVPRASPSATHREGGRLKDLSERSPLTIYFA
ncbi:MAG: hypothetical protein ABJB97_06180, partial [Acidobacteriota bacterium]